MNADLAVYIHWPFCRSKCPYCDFNSVVRDRIDQERWRSAYLRELDAYAESTGGRRVTSVFFGGGTPSLMAPETTAAVLERIARRWKLTDDAEITLEANPTSVEAGRFAAFRAAGINRVSLGVQALDDNSLKALGRRHSAMEAEEAVRVAAAAFDRFSFDLIYARPGQTVAMWEEELGRALGLGPSHLSAYQLTIEEGTAFFPRYACGELALPDEDAAGELYERTQAILEAGGLPAYEISNHARPGQESRHNLTYWRYGDYLGVGPGAHGRLTIDDGKHAIRAHRVPEAWLENVESAGRGVEASEPLDRDARAAECLMMGLRLAEGVALQRLDEEAGRSLDDLVTEAALAKLTGGGFLERTATHLRATAAGRQRLNAVLAALMG